MNVAHVILLGGFEMWDGQARMVSSRTALRYTDRGNFKKKDCCQHILSSGEKDIVSHDCATE